MTKTLFSIGEMAKLFAVSVPTMRYYDQIGLLPPEYTDPATGYRYYSTRQFERLNTIKYLRGLSVPIGKIKCVCENRELPGLVGLLREQQGEIARHRQELELAEQKLQNRLAQLEEAQTGQREVIEERWFGPRPVAYLRREIPLDEDLELPIRELERQNRLEAAMFLGKVGVAVSREDLLTRRMDRFCGIFVFLEGREQAEAQTCLAASEYLVLRFGGVHQDAASYYRQMLAYLSERGYRLAGDSVEIALIDGGITGDEAQFVTELQIPFSR